jgi:L-cysteine/cystine lyase
MTTRETASWFESLRSQLPVLSKCVYLNTGTAGPIPQLAANAMAAEADYELQQGRGNFATWDRFFALLEQSRQLAADVLGAHFDEVALTHHTSEGINIVLWGHDWAHGDEIVTTSLEHDAVCVPLGLLAKRYGVTLRFAEIGMGEDPLAAIEEQLTDRTKLVVLSHIAYNTGALFPIREIAKAAHDRGAKLLVDGAQTCGVLPLDMSALDVDFYTLSGQKWLLGPEGTGALYVARSCLESLAPTFGSYFTPKHHDFRGRVELQPGARRFETGMVHRPSWAAFEASTRWMLESVRLDRAWQRSLQLTKLARERLADIDGLEIISPKNCPSPLLSFDLPSHTPQQLFALSLELARQEKLIIRSTPHAPFCLRATFAFFNTEHEVALLAEKLQAAVEQDPNRLPVEGYALKLPTSR